MNDLRLLVENFYKSRDANHFATSHPSMSRLLLPDKSSAHGSTNSGTSRTFPMIPKENLRLVRIWFKSVLPALPEVLSERLGEIFSISIIRRGPSELGAEPCIQIACPCVPGQAAQIVIENLVGKLWEKDDHEPIPMRFIEGSIKKLSGVEGADDDDGRGSADFQSLDFSYNRPYSKAGMGASIGLLCSSQKSGTLGGYVLLGGKKYLLTSEHIVSKARALADRHDDVETLTSPSRQDLQKFENNLGQNVRDTGSEIEALKDGYDRDMPESEFGDSDLPSDLLHAMSQEEGFKRLCDQVTRDPIDYAVGKVKKLSLGPPRLHKISRSLATELGFQDSEVEVDHPMDWALIETNTQTAQTGENRHKYRSNRDATDEGLYIDETHRDGQSGDVVYDTCGPEAGHEVYYVGQKSKHRYGTVSLPIFDYATKLQYWGIMALDGQPIPGADVAGDSGAWVIRKKDNKLMGQVHSHDQGQVLFTPIDVIFAELEEICGTEVSLPPRHPGSDNVPSTISPRPLCSVPHLSTPKAYKFNKHFQLEPITASKLSPINIPVPEPGPLESSGVMTSIGNTNTTHSQQPSDSQCDSSSSVPTLIDSPLSAVTTPEYPKSPQSSGHFDIADGQVNFERLPSMSLPTAISESTMSENPDLSFNEAEEDQPCKSKPSTIHVKFQSLPGIIFSTRTSTWPVTLGKSEVTKAWPGLRFTQLWTSRKHAVPYSARAILNKSMRSAGRTRTSTRRHDEFRRYQRLQKLAIEDITEIETISSPSGHEHGSLSGFVEDVRKPDYSFMPKDGNVAV